MFTRFQRSKNNKSETSSMDADEIRRRRVAKLAQAEPAAGQTSVSSVVQQVLPKVEKKAVQTVSVKSPLTISLWQHQTLTDIFHVQFYPSSNGFKLLESLAQELQQESNASADMLLFTNDLIERVIVARLSDCSLDQLTESLFVYLLGCYYRCVQHQRRTTTSLSSAFSMAEMQETFDMAKRLIVSYSGILLLMPDTFQQPPISVEQGAGQLAAYLLVEEGNAAYVDEAYLFDLANRFESDGLDEIMQQLMNVLSAQARNNSFAINWAPPIRALLKLMSVKPLAAMITRLPSFNPLNMAPRVFEIASTLGPFFRLSVFPEDDTKLIPSFFANISPEMIGRDTQAGVESLRLSVQNLRFYLFDVTNTIIRSQPVAREAMLTWITEALRANKKRARMQVDPSEVSSDGFIINISLVLLQLCEPLMDQSFSKIHLIDRDYYLHSSRVNIDEATKINADQEESLAYYGRRDTTRAPNFVSDCFFLTASFLHHGFIQNLTRYSDLLRDISQLQKQCAEIKAAQQKYFGTPHQRVAEQLLARVQKHRDERLGRKFCLDALLLDEKLADQTARFYALSCEWLVRVFISVAGKDICPDDTSFPLPQESIQFKFMPEFFLEDVSDFLLFVLRFIPGALAQYSFDSYLRLCMAVLMNPTFIKNPYLKSKLVEVLYLMTFEYQGQSMGGHAQLFTTHSLALRYLIPAVMQFYVDVELTGMSSQFYDKFNIRYNVSQIIKTVWSSPDHRQKLKDESRTDLFVRFVNMLMNDTRYLLDEGLTKLSEIHVIQVNMADTARWDAQEEQVRKEKETYLEQSERQATSYMSLANETVHMLSYMTAVIVEPFLTPEIIDRLAAMLDYNLSQLVGPKCTELKVQDPEKYRFQPKQLLSEILDIYLHLCGRTEFVAAVAHDGRSYNKEWFRRAAGHMMKARLKSQTQIDVLADFVDNVENAIRGDMQTEEELGDIPDEFLDPLMFTLMEDPVILPTSNTTVDRSTIKAHLLGETRDPFNRMPLTINMVVPDVELKAKIEAFKAQARK